MNQLSWSHILQRAESGEASSESGTVVIDFEKRDSQTQQNKSGAETANKAVKDDPKPIRNRPPQNAGRRGFNNIPARHETVLNEKNHPNNGQQQLVRYSLGPTAGNPRAATPDSVAPNPTEARANRTKNVIAATLAIAVFGVLAYQIKQQSVDGNSGLPPAQEARENSAAVVFTANDTSSESSSVAVVLERNEDLGGNQLDLRPSLAEPGDASSADQAALSAGAGEVDPAPFAQKPAALSISPSKETENTMLRRGRDMMERGHIAGARLIFEHLAEQNSALGAFALAQTYDSSFLGDNYAGLSAKSDERLAAKWYERAAKLTNINANP